VSDLDAVPTAALDALYRAEYPRLVAVAQGVLGARALAEEIAHDAFCELLTRTEPVDDPAAWLRTVAWRRAVNAARRRERGRGLLHRVVPAGPARSAAADAGVVDGTDPVLVAALAALPLNQRSAALLVWGDGLSTAEAAVIVGCSAATLRVHLHRARRTLAARLEGADDV
jgi:RNA polymerase sigma-70 factor (ECF subfamily)